MPGNGAPARGASLQRVLIGLSVLLNVVVIGGGVWLAASGVARRLVVRSFIHPMHARWVSQFEELHVAPGDVVFLGDSITEGGSWQELFPGVPVRNRGIGGDVTAGVLERLHQVTAGSPSKVFVEIGTNDLSADVPEDEIVAHLQEIIERIHSEAPGSGVYVQSVLPRSADYRKRIEALNARYAALAAEEGAVFIDLYPLFLDRDGSIGNDLSNDELHLMGPGYILWRDTIDAYVRESGATPSPSPNPDPAPMEEPA